MGRIDLLPKKVTPLIKLTSEILELPEEIVNDVINFKYQELRNWIESPDTPVFWDIFLGKFIILRTKLWERIQYLIDELRKDRDNEELKREFRKMWKLRIELYNYTKSRKNANNSRLQSTDWYTPSKSG
jgi:hypothetical protein